MSIRHARQMQGGDNRAPRWISWHALQRFKERIKQNLPNKRIRVMINDLLGRSEKVAENYTAIVKKVGGKYGIDEMYILISKYNKKIMTIYDRELFYKVFGRQLQIKKQQEEGREPARQAKSG